MVVRRKHDLLFPRAAKGYATFWRVLLIVLFGDVVNGSAIVVFIPGRRGSTRRTRLTGRKIERIGEDWPSFWGTVADHSR